MKIEISNVLAIVLIIAIAALLLYDRWPPPLRRKVREMMPVRIMPKKQKNAA